MKIAITGGAGFIGSHLVRAYLQAGHSVLVIDNLTSKAYQLPDPRARFYQLDIRDSKIHDVLEQERPDVVSHHVGLHSELPCERTLADADVQIRGLLNVLEGSVAAGISKFIFASGGNTLYREVPVHQLPLSEESPLDPEHPCDISKVAGEFYVRYYTHHYGLKHCILRYADVYGETTARYPRHPLSYFIALLAEQRRPIIRSPLEEIRDHIFIDDVISANIAVLERGENQTLHISTGEGQRLGQLLEMVSEAMETEVEPVFLSGALSQPKATVLDSTRAQQILGWRAQTEITAGVRYAIERLYPERTQTLPGTARETLNYEIITGSARI